MGALQIYTDDDDSVTVICTDFYC